MSEPEPTVVNGWLILAHPLFLEALEQLTTEVERLRTKDPSGYVNKRATKRLAAVRKLAFGSIPADPANPSFRQGSTLGAEHAHWCRAKFFAQYRLFFRYHSAAHIIVLAWVNDDSTLRASESDSDAYRTFRKMLDAGNPPTTWDELVSHCATTHSLPPEADR